MALRQRLQLGGVVGRSAALAKVLERLELLASMDNNVLITGTPGSGKSLFARLLHDNSRRRDAPFIAVHCAVLSEDELVGKAAAARNGTLFLDDAGELSLTAQAKVLQLVQGDGAGTDHVDLRVVTATDRDLLSELESKAFRSDLYDRIRGAQLRIPPLRERREDVPLLVQHFCARVCSRNGLPDLPPSPAALLAAEFTEWPGNVRELAAACEEAVVNAQLEHSSEIEPRHLFPSDAEGKEPTFAQSRRRWECGFLQQTLAQHDWNVAQTARALKMSRSHLNALIRRCALRREPA